MYAKLIPFLVVSNIFYEIIFLQLYLIPWITIPFIIYYYSIWYYGIMLMLYLAAVSPQNLYRGMQKYAVIGSTNIYWSKLNENIITNGIFIIL